MSQQDRFAPRSASSNGGKPKDDLSIMDLIHALNEDVIQALRVFGITIESFINIAKFNPTMVASLAIFANDILAHKIDWLHWQHQEAICVDCAGFSIQGTNLVDAKGNVLGALVNGFVTGVTWIPGVGGLIQSLGQIFANHGAGGSNSVTGGGSGAGTGHTFVYVWVPGIITQSANLIVTGMILATFSSGIAGSIISDITNITKLQGSAAPQLAANSVSTLVEQGSQVKTVQTTTKEEK